MIRGKHHRYSHGFAMPDIVIPTIRDYPPETFWFRMIENRLFHLIASHREGVPIEQIASKIFRVKSGSQVHLKKVLLPTILADKRFLLTSNLKLVLSERGEKFKDLLETTFVALDVETTGNNSSKDKITEIGALKIQCSAIVDSFESLVNPGRYIPYDITRLTGITNEMVNIAPTIQQVMPRFLDFIGDAVLIAHNATYDTRFINAALQELGHYKLENQVLCTYRIGRRMFPEMKQHSLNRFTKFFGFVNVSPHRAGSDAAACTQIFLNMLNEMPEKGIFSLNDLLNYI